MRNVRQVRFRKQQQAIEIPGRERLSVEPKLRFVVIGFLDANAGLRRSLGQHDLARGGTDIPIELFYQGWKRTRAAIRHVNTEGPVTSVESKSQFGGINRSFLVVASAHCLCTALRPTSVDLTLGAVASFMVAARNTYGVRS